MIFPFSLKRHRRTVRTGALAMVLMLALALALPAGAAPPLDAIAAQATATVTAQATATVTAQVTAASDSRSYRGCAEEPGMLAIRAYPGLYNLYYENDLFTGSDNNYTNGIKLSWVSSNLQDYVSDPCLPIWVRRLNRLSEVLKPGGYDSRNMVVTLGQAMYTPTDLHRRDLIKNDRPYAGWLYLGLAYNARNTLQMDTTEIDIGVVGPASLARQSQNFVHDLRGFERFEGWDNQLHNELGVQIVRERKNKLFVSRNQNGPQFDLISHYGASLGNVKTYLNGGVELRFGHLPDDFGTASIRPGADSNAPLEANQSRRLNSSGVHVFLALDGRAVARDIFLDGNTFGSSHSVAKKHLVGDAALGVSWQWEGGKVSYAQYLRSKEFYGQDSSHGYGSLTLSLEY